MIPGWRADRDRRGLLSRRLSHLGPVRHAEGEVWSSQPASFSDRKPVRRLDAHRYLDCVPQRRA